MQSKRISLAVDRRGQPIDFTKLLWSSAQSHGLAFGLKSIDWGPPGGWWSSPSKTPFWDCVWQDLRRWRLVPASRPSVW